MQLFVNSVFKKLPWSKIFQGQRWMTLSHFSLFKYRTFSFICPMYIDCGIPYSLVPFFYFFFIFCKLIFADVDLELANHTFTAANDTKQVKGRYWWFALVTGYLFER